MISRGLLIDADTQRSGTDPPQVDARVECAPVYGIRLFLAQVEDQRIEIVIVPPANAEFLESAGQQPGQAVNAAGNSLQALGAVIDAVEARDDREQRLGGTDVAGGLVPANVLLAGLQRHAQCRAPAAVL